MKEVSSDVDILVEQVDMQDEVQIEHMVQAAVARFGRVDYAVNCAGVSFLIFFFPLPSLVALHFSGVVMRGMREV